MVTRLFLSIYKNFIIDHIVNKNEEINKLVTEPIALNNEITSKGDSYFKI